MSDDTERWQRVQDAPRRSERFHARNSTDSRHADADRRRNLDKEEAARDRQIFRWALFAFALFLVMAMMILIVRSMGNH